MMGRLAIFYKKASEYFSNFFSMSVRWNKEIVARERGVWVRIYGMPLHAWNINFFKLCVLDRGRFMRADDFTLEKAQFDYALVAMSSLEVLNVDAKIVVDGVLLEFKIIEEWGFALGEDACLSDEDGDNEDANSDMDEPHDAFDGRKEVDEFLKQLSEDWQANERDDDVSPIFNNHIGVPTIDSSDKVLKEMGPAINSKLSINDLATTRHVQVSLPRVILSPNEEGNAHVLSANGTDNTCNTPIYNFSAGSHNATKNDGVGGSRRDQILRGPCIIKRTTSCHPGRDGTATTGPWSLEWANSQNLDIVGGNLPSTKHVSINSSSSKDPRVNKKKGAGYLRHTTQSMRRIARLPAKDREDVLQALKRNVRKKMRSSRVFQIQDKATGKVAQ